MRQHLPPVNKIVKDGDDLYLASQRCKPLHNNFIVLEDDHLIMILLIGFCLRIWPSLMVKYHPARRSPRARTLPASLRSPARDRNPG